MIDLGNLRGLLEHRHELRVFCPRCHRWSVLDLAALVDAGFGDRRLPLSTRCKDCGSPGELQVRPPMPTRDPATGWLSPGSGPPDEFDAQRRRPTSFGAGEGLCHRRIGAGTGGVYRVDRADDLEWIATFVPT